MSALRAVVSDRTTSLGYPVFVSTATTLNGRLANYSLIIVICLFALCCDVVGLLPGHRSYARRLSALILLVAWLPMELSDALGPYLSIGWLAFQGVGTVIEMAKSWDTRRRTVLSPSAAVPTDTQTSLSHRGRLAVDEEERKHSTADFTHPWCVDDIDFANHSPHLPETIIDVFPAFFSRQGESEGKHGENEQRLATCSRLNRRAENEEDSSSDSGSGSGHEYKYGDSEAVAKERSKEETKEEDEKKTWTQIVPSLRRRQHLTPRFADSLWTPHQPALSWSPFFHGSVQRFTGSFTELETRMQEFRASQRRASYHLLNMRPSSLQSGDCGSLVFAQMRRPAGHVQLIPIGIHRTTISFPGVCCLLAHVLMNTSYTLALRHLTAARQMYD